MMERKEAKMPHACKMKNVQGSWCYVIFFLFFFFFYRQSPSLSLSSLSSSSERITRDTVRVVELNIDSSKGSGHLPIIMRNLYTQRKLLGAAAPPDQ